MGLTLRVGKRKLRVGEGGVVVGRDPTCDVVVNEPTVSRRHARIVDRADGGYVEDLGSVCGVSVNGDRVQARRAIARGDRIRIANVEIEVVSVAKRKPGRAGADADVPELPPDESSDDGTRYYQAGAPAAAAAAPPRRRRLLLVAALAVAVVALAMVVLTAGGIKPGRRAPSVSQADVPRLTQAFLDREEAVAGTDPAAAADEARRAFNNAESRYQILAMGDGYAYEAYRKYRRALALIAADGKPEYYDRLLAHRDACRAMVERKVFEHMQNGWIAMKQERWTEAHRAYLRAQATVPDPAFVVYQEAGRQLQRIAPRLPRTK